MKKITLVLSLAIFSLVTNATFYVVPGGAGAANGSSWTDAYGDIQTAINAASALVATEGAQEVWVKAGTYSTATAAIIMKESVSLYGGFAGTENDKTLRTKGANAWDYSNVSTLNGGTTKRCVEAGAANYINVTVIDGFTMTNGNGQGAQLNNTGGAVLLRANLKLQNCIVTGNTTTGNGGGVNAIAGIISHCWIYSNTTTSTTIPAAGGIYAAPAIGFNTIVEGCLIEKNAQGAVRFQAAGNSTMDRCVIRNNTSTAGGAGIYTNNPGSCTITNCVLTNNKGNNVVYLNKGQMTNCTVANNEGGVYLASASNISEVYNCIVVNNVSNGTTTPNSISVVANYPAGKVKNNAVFPTIDAQSWGGTTNALLITDVATALTQVAFVNPTSFIGVPADATQLAELTNADWSLGAASLALNFGDNSLVPVGITNDLAGNARIVNTTVDAGAFELPYYNTTVTFSANGTVNTYTSGDVDSKPKGTQLVFTITPNAGYKIGSVLYNSSEVKDLLIDGVYNAPALTANSTLVVQFDLATGLQNSKVDFNCFGIHNAIEFSGLTQGDEIIVYNVAGAKVKSEKAMNSSLSFTLPQGIYMVKVANQIKKVIVR